MSSALRQPPLPEDGTGWGGMGGRRDGGGCLTLHKTGATAWPRDLWLLPPPSPRSHPHAADWPSGYECRPSSKSSRHPGAAGAAGAAASEPRGQTHLTASRGGTQRGLGAGLREAGGPPRHPTPRRASHSLTQRRDPTCTRGQIPAGISQHPVAPSGSSPGVTA